MHAAIDLGAGSGRVFLGGLADESLTLVEVHRFDYAPRQSDGHLRWQIQRLFDGVSQGLAAASARAASRGAQVATIGVDSWGVDYGLIDTDGRLLEEPISYRDPRAAAAMPSVLARLGARDLFARTGAQTLAINTLFQLAAHVAEGLPSGADRLLMIPDLCHHFLTGRAVGEYTNATTTQLLNLRTRDWDEELFEALHLPRRLMPELVQPGRRLGVLSSACQARLGLPAIEVVAPGTHDTASAVAGTPLEPGWAFVSSGTWSLVGVELDRPLVSADVAAANCTNEGGVAGTIRFLKNVMGLWVLDACRREWAPALDLPSLVARAASVQGFPGFIDPDDQHFLNPPSMPAAIRQRMIETAQTPPETEAGLTRVILDSLALRYAEVIRTIERVTGRSIPGIHIVGGGSRNAYLNQATADATGRPVIAGPVEATVAGNVLVQAMACGEVASLADGRARVARSFDLQRFEPRRHDEWAEAAVIYRTLTARQP